MEVKRPDVPKPEYKRYMTITECAQAIPVSRSTLYQWISKGLPVIKLEGKTFIAEKSLDEFLHSYEESTADE